jgi:arylsulfatase A-like enzyme
VNPAAIDIPGNRVDEDCSGRDESATTTTSAIWDFPLDGLKEGLRMGLPVILVTNDAMSANNVGFMGYKRPVSPNLDKLAAGCVRFHEAFSQGPSTRISLPSFFTSMFDTQTEFQPVGKNPHPFSPNNLTMAEVFAQNGYETVAVVPKWYFTSMWKGILQGFDEVDERPIKHYNEKKRSTHNAKWVTKSALNQLRKHRDKPLFLWVHYYDVHFPYRQPPGTRSFGPERMDKYDASMLFWDKESAPLFKEIKRQYGKQGYILVVTADHGSAFDERHPKFANGYDLYTATLHIPMLWCGPSFKPQDVRDTPVSLMDVLPTFVNLLGLGGDFTFEGTSLVPLLAGKLDAFAGRHIFHQFFLSEKAIKGKDPLQQVAVRSGTHNYIWNRLQDTRELYEYRKDPWETDNLVGGRAKLTSEMHARLQAWLYRVHKRYNPALKGHLGATQEESSAEESGESGGSESGSSEEGPSGDLGTEPSGDLGTEPSYQPAPRAREPLRPLHRPRRALKPLALPRGAQSHEEAAGSAEQP